MSEYWRYSERLLRKENKQMNNLIQTRRQHIIIYTTVQKFGVSKIFLKEINTFIWQGC